MKLKWKKITGLLLFSFSEQVYLEGFLVLKWRGKQLEKQKNLSNQSGCLTVANGHKFVISFV
ncbi:MAG: hypothetical protein V2G33_07915 [bacterium JZ-2024 1]